MTTEQQAGHTVAHVVTTDTETLLWNSATFPVTPGAPGRLDVQIGTATAHGLAGNAVLIWLDAAGKGVGREFVMDPSDRTPAGETRTDQAGRFTITPPTDANGNPATLHVIYPGSPALRPAHATVSPRSR